MDDLILKGNNAAMHINEARRGLSILRETEQAVDLIRSGLAIYQMSKVGDEDHVVFMTLLASGFERLMKVILILNALEVDKAPLDTRTLMKLGHNLVTLKDQICNKAFSAKYLNRPHASLDLDFIQNNKDFNDLLLIFNNFADARHTSGRYNFMNGATDPSNLSGEWPERCWEEFESRWQKPLGSNWADSHQLHTSKLEAIKHIVMLIERFTRVMYRILLFSGSGTLATSISTSHHFEGFNDYGDKNLGQKIYSLKL